MYEVVNHSTVRQNFPPIFGLLFWLIIASTGQAQDGGTWETRAPMPQSRQELATSVLNGKVYVMGGFDVGGNSTATVQVYDPATDTWALAHSLPHAVNHNSAAVVGGKLYSFGAGAGETFVYSPTNNSWTAVASSNYAHSFTAAVGVINDKIYVAGGAGTPSQRELEVYDPVANTWTVKAPMSVPRNHTAGGVIDGKFYVVGGRFQASSTNALEVYNPQTNTWSTLAPMPTVRSGIAAAVVNNDLWVFGGEDPWDMVVFGAVEVYDPVSNSWRQLPDMPLPRHGWWASVIGSQIYIPGGGQGAGVAPTNTNQIFTVDEAPAQLGNISTRAFVQTGDNVMIGGFIITGSGQKRVIVRAIGPSLANQGIGNPLQNPTLELHDHTGAVIASNDDWMNAPNKQEIIDSGLAPTNNLESAILMSLSPGNYTAIVRGVNNGTGIALVEGYDLDSTAGSKLGNISTRSLVQTGDNVMIGGLIITGTGQKNVIVRAIGPSLAQQGITDPLLDPTLELHDVTGAVIAFDDNWKDSQEAEIEATGLAPSDDRESAIASTLAPGNYTAIVRGKNNTIGVALVEVYDLN